MPLKKAYIQLMLKREPKFFILNFDLSDELKSIDDLSDELNYKSREEYY